MYVLIVINSLIFLGGHWKVVILYMSSGMSSGRPFVCQKTESFGKKVNWYLEPIYSGKYFLYVVLISQCNIILVLHYTFMSPFWLFYYIPTLEARFYILRLFANKGGATAHV